jgi:hypothetical protein
MELTFEGTLPRPPRREIREVAQCLGWTYEGLDGGWHDLWISFDVPLLKSPRVYIREEAPLRYVGRGVAPAGELLFEIRVEDCGGQCRCVFRGVQRGPSTCSAGESSRAWLGAWWIG